MITAVLRWFAVAVAALAVMASGSVALAPASAADPRTDNDSRMEHVDKPRNPRSKSIKPTQAQRQVRYTSESTQLPTVAKCSVLSPNRSDWPEGIVSCEGPAPAPARQAPPPPPPAAAPAVVHAESGAGSGSGGNGAGTSRDAPSCR